MCDTKSYASPRKSQTTGTPKPRPEARTARRVQCLGLMTGIRDFCLRLKIKIQRRVRWVPGSVSMGVKRPGVKGACWYTILLHPSSLRGAY